MDETRGGIELFHEQLSPEVLRDIESWRHHPQLGPLHANLHAHSDRHTFLNTYAEAVVARHLLRHGCSIRFEVPTPTGRRADFEVRRGEHCFYLHVKRLSTDAGDGSRKRLTVSSRLRMLEHIKRPYIVSIRWREGLSNRQMQHLVTRAGQFIEQARVGDELAVRDEASGREIGGARIMAPWEGPNVALVIGLPTSTGGRFVDHAPRMRKLLRKAYLQFMPKATNVVLMGTSHEKDADEFETALLGSHIERWDEHPPRGKRIAHGRDEDGFWHGQRYILSQYAAWFRFQLNEGTFTSKLWQRSADADPALAPMLNELFGAETER